MSLICIDWTITLSVISSIAAIAGVIVGIASWRQVVDSRKARIIIIIKSQNGAFLLVVMNVGQNPAKEVNFKVNQKLLDLVGEELRSQFTSVANNPFTLMGGDQKQLLICFHTDKEKREALSDITIEINGSFIDTYCKFRPKKEIKETLTYSEFITQTAVIPNSILDRVIDIKNSVDQINKKIK